MIGLSKREVDDIVNWGISGGNFRDRIRREFQGPEFQGQTTKLGALCALAVGNPFHPSNPRLKDLRVRSLLRGPRGSASVVRVPFKSPTSLGSLPRQRASRVGFTEVR